MAKRKSNIARHHAKTKRPAPIPSRAKTVSKSESAMVHRLSYAAATTAGIHITVTISGVPLEDLETCRTWCAENGYGRSSSAAIRLALQQMAARISGRKKVARS